MFRVGKQNLILIPVIDTPQCLNQLPGIPTDPDVEILEMPCGNNDLHNAVLNRSMVAETRRLGFERLGVMAAPATDRIESARMEPQATRQVKAGRMNVVRTGDLLGRLTALSAYVTD